jgi:SAM-dependent methyltransferase
VVCTGTLEHVRDPRQAVSELRRILKPGGLAHIDVPFMQGFHADPDDYWRFTLHGRRPLCSDFEEIASGVHIGPPCAVVWTVREWAAGLTTNRILSNLFLAVVAIALWPVKYIDWLAIRSAASHRVASAVFFRGRKRV